MTGFVSWIGKAWWQDTNYLDIVKGKFCNKVNFESNQKETYFFNQLNISTDPRISDPTYLLKPILLLIISNIIYVTGITYMTWNAVKNRFVLIFNRKFCV